MLTVRRRVANVQPGYIVEGKMPWRDMVREVLLPTTIAEGIVVAVIVGFLVWL